MFQGIDALSPFPQARPTSYYPISCSASLNLERTDLIWSNAIGFMVPFHVAPRGWIGAMVRGANRFTTLRGQRSEVEVPCLTTRLVLLRVGQPGPQAERDPRAELQAPREEPRHAGSPHQTPRQVRDRVGPTATFTFRAFSRRCHPGQSTCVRRKGNNNISLSEK